MSHFAVLVITDEKPSSELLEKIMAPWHEFECTGRDDQYIIDVDLTDESREEYEKYTERVYVDAEGKRHDPYDNMFYRDFTQEEKELVGGDKALVMGSGSSHGLSWFSSDWKDGQGYRAKIHFIPEGWQDIRIPVKEVKSFAEWIQDYYGHEIVQFGDNPDLNETHKYGYVEVDEKGDVVKHVRRTNPNAKWDWFQIGGRYSGRLLPKVSEFAERGEKSWTNEKISIPGFDICRKENLDLEKMHGIARKGRSDFIDEIVKKSGCTHEDVEAAAKLQPQINEAWRALEDKPRGQAYKEWIKSNPEWQIYDKVSSGIHVFDDLPILSNISLLQWIDSAMPLSAYAIIDVAGKWHANGEMGWFGMSSNEDSNWETHFTNMVVNAPDDHWFTIVDCHI